MGHMHEKLDPRRLADLAADPDFKPANAAEAVDAAIVHLNNLLAKRSVEDNAERAALDVSRRAAFQAIHADAKPTKFPTHDTLDPEQMLSQIVECREALDAASKALCSWYGQINPERARELMTHAAGFLAEE